MGTGKFISMLMVGCTFAVGVNSFTSPALAQDATLEHTKSVLEKLVQKELDRGVPSISLSLVRGDKIAWSAAWGFEFGFKGPGNTRNALHERLNA